MKKSNLESALMRLLQAAKQIASLTERLALPCGTWTNIGLFPAWKICPDDWPFRKDGKSINVWVGKTYSDVSICFGEVEITLYTKEPHYRFPGTMGGAAINALAQDAEEYLPTLHNIADTHGERILALKQAEIDNLQRQIDAIRSQMVPEPDGRKEDGIYSRNE